jgi:hypothetical protein
MTTDLTTLSPGATGIGAIRRIRTAGSLLMFSLVATLIPSGHAADFGQTAVNRAGAFLGAPDRGKEVLAFVHFGADYHGHKYVETRNVNDGRGAFALVYRFWWEDDGVTDIAFLADSTGYVYRVQIMYTNAIFSQPFLVANASISILGNSLIELYKDKLSDEDRRQFHDLVNRADAKGLLEFRLKLEQVFG